MKSIAVHKHKMKEVNDNLKFVTIEEEIDDDIIFKRVNVNKEFL